MKEWPNSHCKSDNFLTVSFCPVKKTSTLGSKILKLMKKNQLKYGSEYTFDTYKWQTLIFKLIKKTKKPVQEYKKMLPRTIKVWYKIKLTIGGVK